MRRILWGSLSFALASFGFGCSGEDTTAIGNDGGAGNPSAGGDATGGAGGGGPAGGTGGSNGGTSGAGGISGAGGASAGGAGGGPGAGILPGDRRYPWAPGIPGGIPARTQVCANVKDPPYNAVGDGQADDAAKIQAAIDACPDGQVVRVPAGTYRVTETIYLLKGVVLRGDGPATTHIQGDGTPNWAILNLGEQWDESNTPITPIQSGYSKGSKSVVVADASSFSVGELVNIDQRNDGDLVWVNGSESACTYGSRENGERLIGQIVEITSVDTASGAVGFEPALAWDYQSSLLPEMERVHSHTVKYAGIEDLRVSDRTYRGDNNSNVRIHACEYCWAKNIDSDMVSGRHIQVVRSLRCNVEGSTVHHAHCYNPGANAYGIAVERQTSDSLIQDNIVYYLNVGVVLGSAGPGNVIAYNYGDVMWERNYPNTNWLMADFSSNHCAHPYMNLFEGNVGSQISADDIHGSSSHQTYLRNTMDHRHQGIATTGNVFSVALAARNRYMTFLGNVFGYTGDNGDYEGTGNCAGGPAIYKIGWPSDCAAGDSAIDPEVRATLLRHGNHDYMTNMTHWESTIADHTIPASLYLGSKPAFFGSRAWPAIGADLTPMVSPIPAEERFAGMPHSSYGGTDCTP
jgi:hypothetical protein